MLELLVLVAGLIVLVKFGKPLAKSAEAVDIKVAVWSAGVKADAVKDIGAIDVSEAEISSANAVIDRLNSVKFT